MITALALAAYLVRPGDTLSGIAASHGVSLAAVEAANPQVGNPDLIYPGEDLRIPSGGSPAPQSPSPPASLSGPVSAAPGSFQACVIRRESGGNPQVMNSSGHYGLYQFDYTTWASGGGNPGDFGHASVAEQNRVFASVYAARGTQPWAPYDGC